MRGDHFLVYSQQRIIELDQAGNLTATVVGPAIPSLIGYGEFITEKIDAQTGKPYFLMSSGYSANNSFTLRINEYHPGVGFINETNLDETFSPLSSPLVLPLNDSVLFILGRKYFRQVTHHTDHSLVVDWQLTNAIGSPTSGVITGDSIVGTTQDGHIFALSFQGNILWNELAPVNITHLQKVDTGFLACTRSTAMPYAAAVMRLSAAGTVIWTKSFPDQSYEYLLAEPDGSITVTGRSDSSTVVLHHLQSDGNTAWRRTYQTGIGTALLRTPDGGYALTGLAGNRYLVIKTDDNGLTAMNKDLPLPGQKILENSIMKSTFFPSATLFFDNTESTFYVPKADLTTLFFAAAPWVGGLDQDSLLHFAASTYPNDGKSDYRSGLVQSPAADFNRVWSVSRSDIETLQQDWLDDGVIDQDVPYDLLTWPAKGNPDFGNNLDFSVSATDKDLLPAPFVDINGDGKYSVYDGDYPRIRGDQMAWWVLTDDTLHTRTNGVPLLVDIAISAYLYDCATYDPLNNTLFVDFKIINQSNSLYTTMFAGIWSDPDLGCAYDDYIGSLPAEDAFYVYNQDPEDGQTGTTCPGGTPTFGNNVPVGSIAFTNVSLEKFSYYNNAGGSPTPPPGTTDPNYADQYNNYLQGKWLDGSIPTYNGQPIDYQFPDNPADPTGFSMCQQNLAPGDRRVIGSHGPFEFAPNDTFLLSVAFTYHPDIPLPCPDIFGTVQNDLHALHTLVNSGALDPPVNLMANVHLAPGQSVLLDATVPEATAYNWSNGAQTAKINVDQPGRYSVAITRNTGCADLETVLAIAASPTGEVSWLDQFHIFPNPSAGLFELEIHGTAQPRLDVQLFNVLGQCVENQAINFSSGSLKRTFDYSQLPAGMYTLRLQAGEKFRVVKVILQH